MKIPFDGAPELLQRWLKFNFVGAMGIGVQLAAVELASALLHASPALATAVGVEAAVLHNFVWHEKFTWAGRSRTDWRGRFAHFLWFNATTGSDFDSWECADGLADAMGRACAGGRGELRCDCGVLGG